MSEFWDEKNETMPLEQRRALQLKDLQETLQWVYDRIPYYKTLFDQNGVSPNDLKSLEDLAKFPTTTKNDLRDNYPDRLFTVPREELVRYHVSSGTTGKPTVVGYTEKDLELWTESLARALTSIGLSRGDVIQVSYGYGLFTGGLGLHYGAERIGATVLPTSVGNTERQI